MEGQHAGAVDDSERRGIQGLSVEQWTILINLLNAHKGGVERLSSKNSGWLIDFRASHHMTGVIELLSDVRSITPCPVSHPNGDQTSPV